MYNSDTELLFPLRVVPALADMRGEEWRDFITRIQDANADPVDQAGFVLMMVKLDGCIGCNADSFRAMKGCTQCARQNIRRFRGTDLELIETIQQARKEVEAFQARRNSQG
jgi:hypothetical protein